ncbi:putative ankyrin repeat protein [Acanthamoeba polyphaga mimivirus]|uniref:Ankyrin repeat protein n=1 Tax=Acanthamoeba polyphaga mimivirus Kroon TaxID=3069720 RepID=A0A0G2Y224_9VIRU|nr:putative ankyrin repeat protein [Acanthamoeba polyphaga mimivirus]AKI79785.1 putative ankyrin repeat protein [Acanthamoeba polyphaga mimivirus Kroon]
MYFIIANSLRPLHNCNHIDDMRISYVPEGWSFTELKNIYEYIDQGKFLINIELPTNNPEFKIFKCPKTNKLSANFILLKTRRFLSEPKTWEYIINSGAEINDIYTADLILNRVIEMNWDAVLKYLLDIMEKNNVIKFSYKSKHIIDCIEHHKYDLVKFIYVSTHIINCIKCHKNNMVLIFLNKINICKINYFYLNKWYKQAINSGNHEIAKYINSLT